ncbi:MAG TPA: response regulator, partial [Candidatus Obscuribacter sp.]|nr:response regulator [Candidatus Obscuribacter sp.]
MRILLVEDSSMASSSSRETLEQLGLDLEHADSLSTAIELVTKEDFDGILLDLDLKDSSGIGTLIELREYAHGIPIVIYTQRKERDQALQVIKYGAQDYLLKGEVPETSVLRCLRHSVERNKVELELHKHQERIQAILDNSYDAFISLDSKMRITDWNKQAEETFGRTKAEVLGRNMAIIIPHHLRRQYLRQTEKVFNQSDASILKLSSEITAAHKDGREFPVEIGFFRVRENTDYSFCAFLRDISERQRFKEELERQVQERTEHLTQQNELLKQFAKIASHDLQEPLRAVQGFANLLADSTRGKLDKDQEEFIGFIMDGTTRMQNLIRAILLHSESGKVEDGKHATDCNSVLNEVLANLSTSIKESEATFELDRLPRVAVQRLHLIQLFQNMVSNAIKYRGTEPPLISITAEENATQWLFSVRDNGIGIDHKYANKIFDMFARLHGKSQYPGTGMGLAICKRIVTSHGGNIWVESTPGDGSIFFFTLPAVEKVRRKAMKDNIEILLVEDTPSDVRLTQEALKRSDLKYEMHVVNDGEEAMEHLIRLKESHQDLPDVILLDLNMPRKNGHEVLAEIKNDSVLRAIPVVLLTVSENDEDVLEALKLKMNYYIAKPVSAPKLTALLSSIHQLHKESPDESKAFSQDENRIRLVLAGNQHTAPIALTRLAADTNDRVRCRVAENPRTPAGVLMKLSEDSSVEVRLGVSENPNTPETVLEALSKDVSDDVRLGLASNHKLPQRLLENLAEDENIYVAAAAQKTLATL